MARYALNLPSQLKQEAEELARRQGVSLNQFILWAVAEHVGSLKRQLDDPRFPRITYRRGASGAPIPVLRGTGVRVQAIVIAHTHWGKPLSQIAEEYGLSRSLVEEAWAFYEAHQAEIDASIEAEQILESEHGAAQVAS